MTYMTRILLLIVALALLNSRLAGADTYYLSTTGSDSNEGSLEAPFLTLGHAANQLTAGDTLIIEGGTYSTDDLSTSSGAEYLFFENQGTAENPVHVVGSGAVTIRGFYGVYAKNSHVTVSNLSISVALYGIVSQNGGTMQVDSCTVGSLVTGVKADACDGFTTNNCTFSGLLDVVEVKQCPFTANHCTLKSSLSDGVEMASGTGTLSLNRCKIYGVKRGLHIFDNNTATVKNTIIHDCRDHGIDADNNVTLSVYHCTIVDNRDDGVRIAQGSTLNMYNTILASNGDYGLNASEVTMHGGYNLVHDNDDGDYTLYETTGSFSTANDVTTDPAFEDDDYRLSSTSPAIDAGFALTGNVDEDYDSFPRPIDDGWDIGAFEFTENYDKYFVSPTGDDSNNGRVAGEAWKTITFAASQVPPGSTIYVESGTYEENIVVTADGTAEDPITIIASSPGEAIIRPSTQTWIWHQSQADYVTIEGLKFENNPDHPNPDHGIYLGQSTGVTIKDVEASNLEYGIYTYSNTDCVIENCEFKNNTLYSTISYQDDITIDSCNYDGNYVGPYSVWSTKFEVKNSTVINHTAAGFGFAGKGHIENCTVDDNDIGVYLFGCNSTDFTIKNTVIQDCTSFGLYAYLCTLDLTPTTDRNLQFSGCADGIKLSLGTYSATNFTFPSTSSYSCQVYWSDVTFTNCTFTSTSGCYAHQNYTFTANNCDFNGSTEWGLVMQGGQAYPTEYESDQFPGGTEAYELVHEHDTNTYDSSWFSTQVATRTQSSLSLAGCDIDGNKNGLSLTNFDDTYLTMTSTTIDNNTEYGIYATDSTILMNSNAAKVYSFTQNGYGIGTYNCTLTIDNYVISSNTSCNIRTYLSDVKISNSEVTGGADGIYNYWNTSFTLTNTNIHTLTGWGVYNYMGEIDSGWAGQTGVYPTATIQDCTISNLANAVYLRASDDTHLTLDSNTITDNSGYGLYFDGSTHTIDQDWVDEVDLARNGYAIAATGSQITIQNATIPQSTTYSVASWSGTLTIEDSTLNTTSGGIYSYQNTSVTVDRTKVHGTNGTGWGITSYDTPLTVRNSVVAGNLSGILHSQTGGNPAENLVLHNCTFADSQEYGLVQVGGTSDVKNCIFYATAGTHYGIHLTSGTVDHDYNLFYGFQATHHGTSVGTNEIFGKDPKFADAANQDFKLTSGSPAINSGTDQVTVSNDLEQAARPSFKVYEIGAYEYTNKEGSLRILKWEEKR